MASQNTDNHDAAAPSLPPGAGQVTLYQPPPQGNAWLPPDALVQRPDQPILRVALGGQQLRPFCHNGLQRAVLALPGRDVLVVRGAAHEYQVMSHRPSYINALLIQSRGGRALPPCHECATRMAQAVDGFVRPFPTCVRLAGHFGGCCANCKWRDHSARCPFTGLDDDEDETDDGPPPPRPAPGRGTARRTRGPPPSARGGLLGSAPENPIVL